MKILSIQETGDAEYPRRIECNNGGDNVVVFEMPDPKRQSLFPKFFSEATGYEITGNDYFHLRNAVSTYDIEHAAERLQAERVREACQRLGRFAAIRNTLLKAQP